ncbi:LysR family transcriptional regulator [Vibrio sp. SCSIO 43132]|nr:LysR family transcriptional regulator [Vibrio sp. SCSIO 43132]
MLLSDLNFVPVFLALMQTHSTQKAALKLGRSQSYVSKVLAQLREELGDPLFVRGGDGLSPTSYACEIEPKLKTALEQVQQALHPEVFDPTRLDKVTLHIVEPYLVTCGSELIKAIRKETQAVIELRTWQKLSEPLIAEEDVDLGVHILSDKSQLFYQKKLHKGAGYIDGNPDGEYVKFMVSGINEYTHHFHAIDPSIEPTIQIDNYELMNRLMDDCYTIRYAPFAAHDHLTPIELDIAIIVKASRRNHPKIQWLMSLVETVLAEKAKSWAEK